jgi:hypothetical protein
VGVKLSLAHSGKPRLRGLREQVDEGDWMDLKDVTVRRRKQQELELHNFRSVFLNDAMIKAMTV